MSSALLLLTLQLAAAPTAQVSQTSLEAATARSFSATFRTCEAKAASTLAMVDCRTAEAARWDRRLNAAYRADMRDFTPSDRAALQKAQRAWIAFRDANCAAYEDPVQWGSISRVNAADCVLSMTARRALELEDFPPSPCGQASC